MPQNPTQFTPDSRMLNVVYKQLIGEHPMFEAFKSPDHCPEGILSDDENEFYIQYCCVCKDGEMRALILRFRNGAQDFSDQLSDHSARPIWVCCDWGSRDFTEEFPF